MKRPRTAIREHSRPQRGFPRIGHSTTECGVPSSFGFRSPNPGPFQDDDPASPNYQPGNIPDPSTNLLNLRTTFGHESYDVALFVNNALDSRPTILRRNNGGSSTVVATTFRPRTVVLSASWQFCTSKKTL